MQLCEWMIRECDKRKLAFKIKMKKDAFYLRLYFLYILFLLVLILLVVILFIPSGREKFKLCYRLQPVILLLRKVKDRTLKKLQLLNSGDRKDGSRQMKAENWYCLTTKE